MTSACPLPPTLALHTQPPPARGAHAIPNQQAPPEDPTPASSLPAEARDAWTGTSCPPPAPVQTAHPRNPCRDGVSATPTVSWHIGGDWFFHDRKLTENLRTLQGHSTRSNLHGPGVPEKEKRENKTKNT